MKIELRTLQYFLTVAREENITRASEVLYITQPTLSRQMKQLEQELGTELFVRGRNFALTEAGMLLRRRAEEVVDMMYKIESEIETAGEVGGVISIGSGALKSSQFLPEVMSAFQKLHPKVRFEIYSNSSQYIKERMDRGLLDFGIMLEPIDIEHPPGAERALGAFNAQRASAGRTGKRYLRRFVERAFNNACAPLCAKGNIQLAGRRY